MKNNEIEIPEEAIEDEDGFYVAHRGTNYFLHSITKNDTLEEIYKNLLTERALTWEKILEKSSKVIKECLSNGITDNTKLWNKIKIINKKEEKLFSIILFSYIFLI